ncbi:MAG: pilin [Parcubacteria group bacterium]
MKKTFLTVAIICFGALVALPTIAATLPSLVPAECAGKALLDKSKCVDCSKKTSAEVDMINKEEKPCCCDLSSVERTAVNVASIILGLAGSISLLMFVIGGVMYIASAGSPDKVKKATSILSYAVIGLAIILLAGVAVKFLINKLTAYQSTTRINIEKTIT